MSPVAAPEVLELWRRQSCDDGEVTSLDHARFVLDVHAVHRCDAFDAALKRCSVVMP